MGNLSTIPWEACLLEPLHDPALEAYARRAMGGPNPGVRYFARSPWLVRAMVDWMPDNGLLVELDDRTADLIALIVSQENSCRYCYAAVRAMLRIQGMSELRIDQLEQQLQQLEVDPRLAAVARYSRALSHCNPPPDAAAVQRLREAGYGAVEIREIALSVVCSVMLNRVHTIAATPPGGFEQLPDQLLVRWLRPVIAWSMERHRRQHRGHAEPAPPPISGPGAQLLAACGGSPLAPMLARTLQDLWGSALLDLRSRLLLFAVIARGLGCTAIEQEVAQKLGEAGEEAGLLPQVLAHLDAPALTPLQRRLVGFARETIRYEPQRLQQHARQLRAELSPEQFTEALGVLALANGLCRLDMALRQVDG
ncbi:MAG TPA: carboxymuconolactone decarboxylase family protein [Solimonas sp.]|nr:carboxymuconolactone decarboxylase family protein [Solimonas sp.]